MSRTREMSLIAGIFLVAVIVAGVFPLFLPAEYRANQSSDYESFYEPVGRAIAQGEGITWRGGELASRYPPGFPILLSGVYWLSDTSGVADSSLILLFRILSAGISALLIYALARLFWQPALAAISALAWLLYPFWLWLAKQPNSEVPFVVFFFASIYLVARAMVRSPRAWWLYLLGGALAGAAMLIRPIALGLPVILGVIVVLLSGAGLLWRSRLWLATLILIGSFVVVLPWEAALYAETGQIIPLSRGGKVTIKDGFSFLVVEKDYRRDVTLPADVEAMMLDINARRDEMDTYAGIARIIAEEFQRDPVAMSKVMLLKAMRSWYGIDSRILEIPTIILQVFTMTLVVLGSIFAWREGDKLRKLVVGVWLIVLYFWVMTIIVIPLFRYMLPVMGLLFLFLPGVYVSVLSWRRSPGAGLQQLTNSEY